MSSQNQVVDIVLGFSILSFFVCIWLTSFILCTVRIEVVSYQVIAYLSGTTAGMQLFLCLCAMNLVGFLHTPKTTFFFFFVIYFENSMSLWQIYICRVCVDIIETMADDSDWSTSGLLKLRKIPTDVIFRAYIIPLFPALVGGVTFYYETTHIPHLLAFFLYLLNGAAFNAIPLYSIISNYHTYKEAKALFVQKYNYEARIHPTREMEARNCLQLMKGLPLVNAIVNILISIHFLVMLFCVWYGPPTYYEISTKNILIENIAICTRYIYILALSIHGFLDCFVYIWAPTTCLWIKGEYKNILLNRNNESFLKTLPPDAAPEDYMKRKKHTKTIDSKRDEERRNLELSLVNSNTRDTYIQHVDESNSYEIMPRAPHSVLTVSTPLSMRDRESLASYERVHREVFSNE